MTSTPFASAIAHAYRAAAEEKAKYPRLARLLHDAGVRKYVVDVATGTITYVGESASDTHEGTASRAIAGAFSEEGTIAALRASQQGKISYEQFLDGIAASGVQTYLADLAHGVVVYMGHGRLYEERIPPA